MHLEFIYHLQCFVLGVIAFPTAMYHGSPFQCTFCTKDLCPAHITDKMVCKMIKNYLYYLF